MPAAVVAARPGTYPFWALPEGEKTAGQRMEGEGRGVANGRRGGWGLRE